MAELDDIIHQPLRLRIMAALNALPLATGLEFSKLKKLTGATDGNLGAHIETLAKAGYVSVEKAFVGRKPQTTVTATAAGRGAFARHVATLQEIIAASGGRPLIFPLAGEGELVRPTMVSNTPSGCISCTSFCSVPAAANMPWRGRSQAPRC